MKKILWEELFGVLKLIEYKGEFYMQIGGGSGLPQLALLEEELQALYEALGRIVGRKKERVVLTEVRYSGVETICQFSDGSITTASAGEGDMFNKEVGLAICLAKQAYGGQYSNLVKLAQQADDEDSLYCAIERFCNHIVARHTKHR